MILVPAILTGQLHSRAVCALSAHFAAFLQLPGRNLLPARHEIFNVLARNLHSAAYFAGEGLLYGNHSKCDQDENEHIFNKALSAAVFEQP